MKVLIINQHTLNFGDDIAGISLIQNLLNINDVERIDIIYNTKGKLLIDDSRIFHNEKIMLKNIGYWNLIKYFLLRKIGVKNYNEPLNKMIYLINNADYIFVSPCGANIGIYKDWRFLIKLLIVIMEKKTPIFHLNTIGKSSSFIFDFFAKKVLKKSIIYVREQKSLEYIKKIGLDGKFGVDTAFSFIDDQKNYRDENNNTIAFVPTVLKSWHPNFKKIDVEKLVFEDILPIIADFSKKNNLIIELIPHLNNDEEKEYYKKIEKYFSEHNSKVKYRKDVDTVYKYNEAIKNAKFVIGMRYHSIVLAIKNYKPFVSLSYENKMQEVCNYSEKSKYSLKLYDSKFDKYAFENLLEDILENRNKIENELKEIVENKLIPLSKIPLEQIK